MWYYIKHADGQKIAKRLSRQISRETSLIKKYLCSFNTLSDDSPLPALSDVLSPQASFWISNSLTAEDQQVSSNKHKIIRNYLVVKRVEEGFSLLSSDMENTLVYFNEQKEIIEKEIERLEQSLILAADDDAKLYMRGCICVLRKFSWCVADSLRKATAAAAVLCTSYNDQIPADSCISDIDKDLDYFSSDDDFDDFT